MWFTHANKKAGISQQVLRKRRVTSCYASGKHNHGELDMRMMIVVFLIVNKLYRIIFKLSTTALSLDAIIGTVPGLRI